MPRKPVKKTPAYRPKNVRRALLRAGKLLIDETRYLNGGHFAPSVQEHEFFWVGKQLIDIAQGKIKTLDAAFGVEKKGNRLVIADTQTGIEISQEELAWVRKVGAMRSEGKSWERIAEELHWHKDVSTLRSQYTRLDQPENIQAEILQIMDRNRAKQ